MLNRDPKRISLESKALLFVDSLNKYF